MSREDRGQSCPAPTQQDDRAFDPARRLRDLLGVGRREFLTTDQIAREFAFSSAEAARKWIHRHDVPVLLRDRTLLVDRPDMERALAQFRGRRRVRQVA